MKWKKAVEHLEKGAKITKKDWKDSSFLVGSDPIKHSSGRYAIFSTKQFKDDDWMVKK